MNLGLLLVPALGGYYLLGRCYVSRYWIGRRTGYALFFSAAIAGFLLFVVARLLAISLPHDPTWPIVDWWNAFAPFEHAETVLITGLLAVTLPEVVNVFTRKYDCATWAARTNGDLIECLIQESVESKGRLLVEVSTKDSKSYIGFGQHSSVTAGSDPDIAITPIASGYRSSETRELTITTSYVPALVSSWVDIDDFRVVIPLSEITSARRFIPSAGDLFGHITPSPSTDMGGSAKPQAGD